MIRIKRKKSKFWVCLLVLFFVLRANLSAKANIWHDHSSSGDTGQVIVVYDGDTVKIRFDDGRVRKARLIGINTPEIEEEREDVRFLAHMAKRFTFFHLYRRHVKIEYDWERTDRYGRLLVYVWTEREGLFNEFILREGYAFVFTQFPYKTEYRNRFTAAERQARELGKGLWRKGPFPTIATKDVFGHVGELLSVRYVCTEVRARGNFVYLNSSGDFSAVIPRKQISLFPEVGKLKGRTIAVKGFLETYKGEPQIMVFLPVQLHIGD